MQFWVSEQYGRDIPFNDKRSYEIDPHASIFSGDEMQRFMRQAEDLNARGQGDQAAFYLRKMPDRA
jgi:hypothetical protein